MPRRPHKPPVVARMPVSLCTCFPRCAGAVLSGMGSGVVRACEPAIRKWPSSWYMCWHRPSLGFGRRYDQPRGPWHRLSGNKPPSIKVQ